MRFSCAGALAFVLSAGCGFIQEDREVTAEKIRESEELILALTPRLADLTRDVLDLEIPRATQASLFANTVAVVDLSGSPPTASGSPDAVAGQSLLWHIQPALETSPRESLSLWGPFLDSIDYFEHATFYFVRGHLTASGLFETYVGFDGLARTRQGVWRSVHATQRIDWQRSSGAVSEQEDWRITRWHLETFGGREMPERLFSEALDWALRDPAERRNARRSVHEEHVVEYYEKGTLSSIPSKYRQNFRYDSGAQHPGLSVVDVDRDGFDDLYVMTRWGRNQLYRNQGDGTFREIAGRVGLDIEHVSSSGIFGDFDNDGDLDLVLGRTLEPSMYLVNEDGVFVDRTQSHVDADMPYLVASVSAVDYNGDGLLDVYLSTYGKPRTLEMRGREDAERFLSPGDQEVLRERVARLDEWGHYLDAVGPPNVLLVNKGEGRFGVASESAQLAVWRNTLQATWADFDTDGDPDVYVANDFAPDNFFRNDGSDGFVDVTRAAAGDAMMGFGMGASWGDYDNDGRQDLYVSNMYSKAGMRIAAQVDGVDQQLLRSTEGNLLFKNRGSTFDLVSGLETPALAVAKAGWSWGGQFVDVDNDMDLDLYVSSGFFTAPPAVAGDVDL